MELPTSLVTMHAQYYYHYYYFMLNNVYYRNDFSEDEGSSQS